MNKNNAAFHSQTKWNVPLKNTLINRLFEVDPANRSKNAANGFNIQIINLLM